MKKGMKIQVESNNDAEYATSKLGLQMCAHYGVKRFQIKGDALLVVKQVLGMWQGKIQKLKQLYMKVRQCLKSFERWTLKHINREQNKKAHEATQSAITEVFSVIKTNVPMYLGRESLEKEEQFLLTHPIPKNVEKYSKYAFVRRATRYKLINDILFMKGADLVLRRVPWKEEIYKILEKNHEGDCGGHFAVKITLHKVLQEGYVWPSICKRM